MKTIDINGGWRIEGWNLNEGLARKAYRRDYAITAQAVETDLPKIAQAALFENGRLPDPCVDTQSDDHKWVEEKEWWYFREFEAPVHGEGQRVSLRFEGVTYRADIWLNGHTVGHIEGMFRLDEFDITEALNPAGPNRLVVRVRTQEDAIHDDRGNAIRGKVRNQGVVAQAMYRWNWCPHLVGVGIWRPVSLIVRDAVEIEDVRVRTVAVHAPEDEQTIPAEAPAEIEIAWRVHNHGTADASVQIRYELAGETFELETPVTGTVEANVGANTSTVVMTRLSLESARLWWCNGLGEAHLYRLRSRLTDRDESGHDARDDRFGIREIRFVENDDAEWVTTVSGHTARPWTMIHPLYNWILQLNGRRVFLKGSNWVHADVLLRLERSRYEEVLLPAKEGGLNFMRVWGGSLAETEEFYDVCDRYGLLCWQEFWLACENYPALDRSLLARCARDTVRRLYNHPSLVFYSGGNEFEPDHIDNCSAVDTLARVVAEEDPSREFRRSSPYKGDKHGGLVPTPTGMRNKYLDILPGDKRQVLFRSEVAVGRSAPAFASLEKFIPEGWPLDEKRFRHFFGVPSEFLGFAREYAADDSFQHAVIANHLAHIRVLQVNLEYCRMQMFRCGGHLNWQYSVPWPCLHREIVDWWGVPKPVFYHYANACRPLALFVDLDRYLWNPGEAVQAPIYLVNDLLAEDALTYHVELRGMAGEVLHSWSESASIGANEASQVGTLAYQIPENLAGRTLLVVAQLRRGEDVVFQHAYLVAISPHVHSEATLGLDGEWERPDGSTLTLPGNDMQLRDDGFESIVQKSLEKDFEQTAENRDQAAQRMQGVRYRRTFTLPESLRGKPLELFSPGFEASYEIAINGQVLATHELRASSLDLAAMAHVPWRKDAADARIDPETEYRFFSDPITLQKLDPCFVDIPQNLLNPHGENEITLTLKTDSQKVVSQSMCIRERTPNREEVSAYLKRGTLFGDLRAMPQAELDVHAENGRIVVQNGASAIAMMVLLDVEIQQEGVWKTIATDDNALILLPGERRTIRPLRGDAFPSDARLTVRGWNTKTTRVNLGG